MEKPLFFTLFAVFPTHLKPSPFVPAPRANVPHKGRSVASVHQDTKCHPFGATGGKVGGFMGGGRKVNDPSWGEPLDPAH